MLIRGLGLNFSSSSQVESVKNGFESARLESRVRLVPTSTLHNGKDKLTFTDCTMPSHVQLYQCGTKFLYSTRYATVL